ncbi:MAG: cellulose-binding protein [Bacteroidetes bacterium]|nr:cellulose-binding protein [Bacteroidota bacterium]
MKALNFFSLLFIISFFSCKKDNKEVNNPAPATKPFIVKILPETTYQTIAGFGGANRMWGTMSLKPAEALKAFGTEDNQLGLSIFRVRISSNKAEWNNIIEAVKEANQKGVTVLASPWSPPANLKDNKSDVAGHLLPENYKAFKDYINEFIKFMAQNGAKIDVVSIQNEPDVKVIYESCDWTADEMIAFLNAPGKIEGAKVAAPESFNFNPAFTNALLNNQEVASKFDIVAGHIYGSGLGEFPLAVNQKKEVWMTEYLMNLNTGNAGAAKWNTYSETVKWAESLKMLESVHDAMKNNWNAYVWWYLQRYYSFIGDGEENTVFGEVLKRGYAFSHFSRFIRPGFVRIGAETTEYNTLRISSYKKDNQIIIVVINSGDIAYKRFQINGLNIKEAFAYTTDEKTSMKKTNLSVTEGLAEMDITSRSVTTFVLKI